MYTDSSNLKEIKTQTIGNSGVTYSIIEYKTPEGKLNQLRIHLKGNAKVVVENGTVMAFEKGIKVGKEDRIAMLGGLKAIPTELKEYSKPALEGEGEVHLNVTKKYLHIMALPKKTSLIVERGYLLAFDGEFQHSGGGGFSLTTSWNRNLRTAVNSYRDITTSVIAGKGALVLELDVPHNYLVEYDITQPVILNEDAVVMRTRGLERKVIDEDSSGVFSDYSGVKGRGVMYTGKGRIWIDPTKTLPSEIDVEILKSFNEKENEEQESEEVKRRGSGLFDIRR